MARLKIGNIKGPTGATGKDGVSITGIELKETSSNGSKIYNLILSSGSKLEFTAPIGPTGNTGGKGEQGVQGVQGVGIESVRYKNSIENGSYVYTITLTNKQTYEITCPIGPKGDKGEKGDPGESTAVSLRWGDILEKPSSFPSTWSSVSGKPVLYNKNEIDEKFKNFCPYAVGDIYITTKAENPSTTWLGTTWSKIEGRFLLGTSSSQASKLTGGSMSRTISQANLPNVKLTVNSFSLGRGNMDITGTLGVGLEVRESGGFTGAFYTVARSGNKLNYSSFASGHPNSINFSASKSWTGTTNSVSPQTNSLGSGQALDITPSYYTTHMWLRTS